MLCPAPRVREAGCQTVCAGYGYRQLPAEPVALTALSHPHDSSSGLPSVPKPSRTCIMRAISQSNSGNTGRATNANHARTATTPKTTIAAISSLRSSSSGGHGSALQPSAFMLKPGLQNPQAGPVRFCGRVRMCVCVKEQHQNHTSARTSMLMNLHVCVTINHLQTCVVGTTRPHRAPDDHDTRRVVDAARVLGPVFSALVPALSLPTSFLYFPLLGRDAASAKQLVAASWQRHAGLIHTCHSTASMNRMPVSLKRLTISCCPQACIGTKP